MASVIKIDKKMKDKIEQTVMSIAAPQIFQDIEGHYKEVVEEFYDDYSPEVYDRTGNLYLGSSGAQGIEGNVKKIANGFVVGIAVDGSFIEQASSSPYFSLYDGFGEADTKLIFKNAFVNGFHGNSLPHFGYSPKITKPSPIKMMDDWFTNYCNTEFKTIVNSALAVALRQI